MKLRLRMVLVLALVGCLPTTAARAFCGFFVAKAGTGLFNKASKVALVRDDKKTVVTMASDYQGEPKDFAMVIPVPEVLQRKQIHIGDPKVLEHLDAYTAPRLVEYFDPNPCSKAEKMLRNRSSEFAPTGAGPKTKKNKTLGVTIEAEYQVGEYDILILSAKQSDGLSTWLRKNDYKLPKGATKVLASYIKQGLKFFVAKVNLERHDAKAQEFLRPLQMAYESARFELPIRLGTLNAAGPQDLFVFTLTRRGRVEVTNYQTKKLPTGMEVPVFVKEKFPTFYKDMFSTLVKRDEMKYVYTEYAWDMNWCDPCAADPLSTAELKSLGVFWVKDDGAGQGVRGGRGSNVFVTRLHMRYTAETFPQDLKLQETSDRNNFQGRYIIRHPYEGRVKCERLARYRSELEKNREKRAQALANLTEWPISRIRKKMSLKGNDPAQESWIDGLWDN